MLNRSRFRRLPGHPAKSITPSEENLMHATGKINLSVRTKLLGGFLGVAAVAGLVGISLSWRWARSTISPDTPGSTASRVSP